MLRTRLPRVRDSVKVTAWEGRSSFCQNDVSLASSSITTVVDAQLVSDFVRKLSCLRLDELFQWLNLEIRAIEGHNGFVNGNLLVWLCTPCGIHFRIHFRSNVERSRQVTSLG